MQDTIERIVVEKIVREVVMSRLAGKQVTDGEASGGSPRLVVNASARHMHISKQDLATLFGPGAQLHVMKDLFQDGYFAAKETVNLLGPRNRLISNLRILGPVRDHTQVELASTDAVTLGIPDLPVRHSGDIAGTPGAYVIGPAGMLELKQGVIRAAMHVHMGPSDAAFYGVKDQGTMRLIVRGDISVTYDNLLVRVAPGMKLEVHMDTDEANACDLAHACEIRLEKQD